MRVSTLQELNRSVFYGRLEPSARSVQLEDVQKTDATGCELIVILDTISQHGIEHERRDIASMLLHDCVSMAMAMIDLSHSTGPWMITFSGAVRAVILPWHSTDLSSAQETQKTS